jgi:hypothetical protein
MAFMKPAAPSVKVESATSSLLENSLFPGECYSCGGSGPHSFCQGSNPYKCGPSETGCHCEPEFGQCGLDHDDCPGFAALPNRAEELLAKHDFTSLRQLIAGNDKVVLNTERETIQFVGCDGSLSAHIALTKAAFAQLAK